MKFSLPYTSGIGGYIDTLEPSLKDHINDLYFADPVFNPSARYLPGVEMEGAWDELVKISESHNISMHYIMNSSVWKNDVYTTGKQQIIDNVNEVYDRGCRILTINNMFLLRDVQFRSEIPEDLIIKVSINNKISTLEEVEFLYEYNAINHFILDRSLNRNLEELKRINEWREGKDVTLTLLAQEGCLTRCPWKSTCDNMIATFHDYDEHEVNDLKLQHSTHFCTVHYNNHPESHLKSPWIPPTAVDIYDDVVDYIKLAGRMTPISILQEEISSYLERSGDVNISSILTLNTPSNLTDVCVDDLEIHGYSAKVSNCNNKCSSCNFCDVLYERLGNDS